MKRRLVTPRVRMKVEIHPNPRTPSRSVRRSVLEDGRRDGNFWAPRGSLTQIKMIRNLRVDPMS